MASERAKYNVRHVVQNLDAELVPSSDLSSPRRRLVIVGDVHGQRTQLKKLLDKVEFNKNSNDHLILTGDLINKGPDSTGVVQLAMGLGASAVRGNNEDRVLAAYAALKYPKDGDDGKINSTKTTEAGNESRPTYYEPSDIDTLSQLSEDHVEWLASLPLILRIGPLQGAKSAPWDAGDVLVVHGGLQPSLSIEKQDPWAVMNMRGLLYSNEDDPETTSAALAKDAKEVQARREAFSVVEGEGFRHLQDLRIEATNIISELQKRVGDEAAIPVSGSVGKLWRDAWNEAQNLLDDSTKRVVVVYGHDARAGLQVEPELEVPAKLRGAFEGASEGKKWTRYTFGLDSGCTYGHELSALVVEFNQRLGDVVHHVVQVGSLDVARNATES